MMKIVLDTNVLVSALLRAQGPSARILDIIVSGHVTLLWDERILQEYREVLLRPKFGFDRRFVLDLVDFLESEGVAVTSLPLNISIPDPDDLPFLEVALTGQASFLVTGNKKDYGRTSPIPIVSPRDFLETIKSS